MRPQFQVIAGILGDGPEKFIQVTGHLVHRSPIFLALVLLFKDKSGEIGAQQI